MTVDRGEGSYLNNVDDAQVRFFRCGVLSLHEDQCHLISLEIQNNILVLGGSLTQFYSVLFGPGPCQYLEQDVWSRGLCRER